MSAEIEESSLVRAQDAIGRLILGGHERAIGGLFRAGHAVADVTQALGKRKHGPLWSRPAVRLLGSDAVAVSYRRVRPQTRAVLRKHFTIAKRSEWPKALRK